MLAGLLVAIALLAPVAGEVAAKAEPAAAATADLAPTTDGPANDGETKAANRCPTLPNAQPGEIVVCAERPQGYRLDPDVLEANRAKRSGRPKRPERLADTSCASVGPMGCMGAGAGIVTVIPTVFWAQGAGGADWARRHRNRMIIPSL